MTNKFKNTVKTERVDYNSSALTLAIIQLYNYKSELEYESGLTEDEAGILSFNYSNRRLAP